MREHFFNSRHFLATSTYVNTLYLKWTPDVSTIHSGTILLEVKTAVSNSQQELLSSITSLMDSRLSSFQTSIHQTQFEISQTQISKMEETLTDSYTFQRKGNEK